MCGIGGGVAITKLISNDTFNRHADVFTKPDSSPEEIAAAGETALLIVYNGKTESLDRLRYTWFCEKVASSTSQVQPTALPPISSSAY